MKQCKTTIRAVNFITNKDLSTVKVLRNHCAMPHRSLTLSVG